MVLTQKKLSPNNSEFTKLSAGEKYRILKGRQHGIPYEDLPPPTPKFPVPYTDNEFLGPELASEIWITAEAEDEALNRWRNGEKTPAYTLSARRKREAAGIGDV